MHTLFRAFLALALASGSAAFASDHPAPTGSPWAARPYTQLRHAPWGARMQKVDNDSPGQLFSWVRRKNGNKVLALSNLSDAPVQARLTSGLADGTNVDFQTGKPVTFTQGEVVELPAWGFRLAAKTGE